MSMLRLDLRGTTTVEGDNDAKTWNKKLIFKNNAPFIDHAYQRYNTFIDNTEDLDIC